MDKPDATLAQEENKVEVIVEIGILGNKVRGPPQQRHFEQVVVVRITTERELTDWLNPH